jgi:signal transduction histidine kinase
MTARGEPTRSCTEAIAITRAIVGLHWAWTAVLFVEPALWPGMFTMLLACLLMSVGVMHSSPVSLSLAAIGLALLWTPAVRTQWPQGVDRPDPFAIASVGALLLICASRRSAQGLRRRCRQKTEEVERLMRAMRECHVELQQLRHRADERLQERSTFFAAASHDFGQRLHALKLMTATARDTEPAQRDAAAERLFGAVTELDHYVRHVLDFARLEGGVYTQRIQCFNLQDVFQQVSLAFEATAAARGVELRVRTCDVMLRSDPGLLLRLVENLVANAIKFTRGGVLLAARRDGARWRIEVWDQGPGIASEDMRRIFEPFRQLRAPSRSAHEGVGLGLATASRLAAFMHMNITLRTRPGAGTVFLVAMHGEKLDDAPSRAARSR